MGGSLGGLASAPTITQVCCTLPNEPILSWSAVVTERTRLLEAASEFGTPLYVYDLDALRERVIQLREAFGSRFRLSYAVKANPNQAVLAALGSVVDTLDVSSWGEMERACEAGCSPSRISFSGPAKRQSEIERAVIVGVGELVIESLREAQIASACAEHTGRIQPVLVRINPASTPRHFGVNMGGKPSQFGIDEEDMEPKVNEIARLPGLTLNGFHIYSGSNSLSVEAIAENFGFFINIFERAVAGWGGTPSKLVFGAGFGVPYLPSETELNLSELAAATGPALDHLRGQPAFASTQFELELGRWLVGPVGWLLSSIVGTKHSRGSEIRICDAGFNNHLAAYGMMGSFMRRNWRIANLSNPIAPPGTYTIVGPLCTTLDTLATRIELPELRVGDVIAIENSGAYGLTSSPTRFISHPEPREVVIDGGSLVDVTERGATQIR